MEVDFITIEPVVLNWFALCFPFFIAGCIIVVALVCGITMKWRLPNALGGILSILFLASTCLGIACTALVSRDIVEQTVLEHQVTALESQLGYTHVTIQLDDANNAFIASTADGQYVSGKLVKSDTDTYIVVLT